MPHPSLRLPEPRDVFTTWTDARQLTSLIAEHLRPLMQAREAYKLRYQAVMGQIIYLLLYEIKYSDYGFSIMPGSKDQAFEVPILRPSE